MKSFIKNHPGCMLVCLCGAMVLITGALIHQGNMDLWLQTKIAAQTAELNKLKQTHAELVAGREAQKQQRLVLDEYDKRIPLADGSYVWVSRILQRAVPDLNFQITPPDFSGQVASSSAEYCTGTFQVRGFGRMDEFLRILQELEQDLPFARVQDLQFFINSKEGEKMEFSFSLMAIMKLDQNSDS